MKNPPVFAAAIGIAVALLTPATPAVADLKKPAAPPAAKEAKDGKEGLIWHTDPTCQFVFFAILEGLFKDGVPEEVIDLIIPEGKGLKHSFVFRCELCHAAFEAFSLYQKRAAFAETKGGASTFGSGGKEGKDFTETIEQLKSPEILTRLRAMGGLVRGWIDQRMATLRLTDEERKDLLVKMVGFADAGNDRFFALRRNPKTVYFEWQFYDGCQACKAAEILADKEDLRK